MPAQLSTDPARAILAFAEQERRELGAVFRIEPADGDGYRVVREGTGWVIIGNNARSCLYGLYHVRQGRASGSFQPAFSVRGLNLAESIIRHTPEELRTLIQQMAEWRMNTLVVHVAYGFNRHRDLIVTECRKRGIDLVFYVYTSLAFLPPDAPSRWLAKRENGEPITRRPECETRMCLNEPEGLAAFEQGAQAFFKQAVGSAHSVLAMTGDGYSHCRCPACRSLAPAEQWTPLLQRFTAAGRAMAPGKQLETLLYVQRYAVPSGLDTYQQMDRLLFDLHIRMRWCPLGVAHPPTSHNEADVDPRARLTPINIYLQDRLLEWRRVFPGTLYLFENLQLHGAMSCPQPYTGVLIEDLRRLRTAGINGMVLEALNGRTYFLDQLGRLAEALWDPDVPYVPGPLEAWCRGHCPPHPLFFLKRYEFPWDAFKDQLDDTLRVHMFNLREFFSSPTRGTLRRTLEHTAGHARDIDHLSIAFRLLKSFHWQAPFAGVDDRERHFLEITKLWDFQEPLEDPIGETLAVIESLVRRL